MLLAADKLNFQDERQGSRPPRSHIVLRVHMLASRCTGMVSVGVAGGSQVEFPEQAANSIPTEEIACCPESSCARVSLCWNNQSARLPSSQVYTRATK